MNQKSKDAVMASFVADALSLGVHWVYDISEIENTYGRIETMVTPELAPYHKPKQKGAFTHYGDQMMVLLESVNRVSGFDPEHFGKVWQKLFQSYDGYVDHATNETLDNFKSGKTPETSGSLSLDLGGAARMAPLVLCFGEDVDALVEAASIQTTMTHNNRQVIECAELFARTSILVLQGLSPLSALGKSLDAMPGAFELHQMVNAGIKSRTEDTRQTIGKFGQMCSVPAALPSTVHLIAKYENNLTEALIENIMAGGDSSARGMLAGLIIGSYQGIDSIPDSWLTDLTAYERILGLMNGIK